MVGANMGADIAQASSVPPTLMNEQPGRTDAMRQDLLDFLNEINLP